MSGEPRVLGSLYKLINVNGSFFPAPRASMTVAEPVTMSPPANTPGMLVWYCSSTTMLPWGVSRSSGVLYLSMGFGVVQWLL